MRISAKSGCPVIRAIESYPIVVFLMFVYESLQDFRGIIHLIVCLMAERLETFLLSFFIHCH